MSEVRGAKGISGGPVSDKAWKAVERRVARLFGTRRTPLSGGNDSRTRSDTLSPDIFIEVKHRKKHSAASLWYEVDKLAKKEGKITLVVLAEKRRKHLFAIVPLDRVAFLNVAELMVSP